MIEGRFPLGQEKIRVDPDDNETQDGLVTIRTDLSTDEITPINQSLPPMNEYSVQVELWVSGYEWFVDGAGVGSGPVASHHFVKKGDHTITLEVTWAGRATVSGPLGTFVEDFEPATYPSSRPYHVIEIRGGLVR